MNLAGYVKFIEKFYNTGCFLYPAFLVYFTKVSTVYVIACSILGCAVNDKCERNLKDAVTVTFATTKQKTPARIVCNQAGI
jgi:hypothetical protein